MTVVVKLRLSNLEAEADRALVKTARKLGQAFQAGFEDPVYAWPGVTKRRNGEVAGTQRNVKDLGTLQASQTGSRTSPGQYQFAWTADHAAATFLGAVYKRRKYMLPARNVPLNVLRDFNFEAAFADNWG